MPDALDKIIPIGEDEYGKCINTDCRLRLTSQQIADGELYCSDDCQSYDLNIVSEWDSLFDNPEDMEPDDD